MYYLKLKTIIESIINSISNFIINSNTAFNSFFYEISWILILIGIIFIIIYVIKYYKNYAYIAETYKFLKISLLTIVASYFIKNSQFINLNFNDVFINIFVNFPIIIVLLLLGYFIEKVLVYKNDDIINTKIRYLNYAIKLSYVYLLLSTNEAKYVLLSIIWQIAFLSRKFNLENRTLSGNNSCDLYESRKHQLEYIKDLIKDNKYDNYAIALNGEWGSGKSKLISSLINDSETSNDYYIYIEPMVSDTQESLIRKFQEYLSRLMKNNGIFSGKNSTVDNYFTQVLNLVQFNNKVSLADFIKYNDYSNISFEKLRDDLQKDIDSLLCDNNKIVVILDDFDRIDADKQFVILTFIKEIINFKGCITIIAFDYKKLGRNTFIDQEYLEKFVGIRIQLVDVEFNEIIDHHIDKILNDDNLKNKFSKEILQEIKSNIISYFNNIEKKINDFITIEKNITYKETDKEKEENEKLNKFIEFNNKRKKYLNNSRRIMHFLNEIKSSIILIDELYENREQEIASLIKIIRLCELVFFMNFIKVFYNEAYELIVKLKGFEEYRQELIRNEEHCELSYINTIIEDIIPKSIIFRTDERKRMVRENTLNFIKDVFINYYFTKNNIDLFTKSEKILIVIDNNEININNDYTETLITYKEKILEDNQDKEKLKNRLITLINYMKNLYKNHKICINDFLVVANSKYNVELIEYAESFLDCIYNLIKDNVGILVEKDFTNIKYGLEEIESVCIKNYKYYYIELLKILLNINKEEEFNKIFYNVNSIEDLYIKGLEYCIKENLLEKDNSENNFSDFINNLIKLTENKEFQILDIQLITNKLIQFTSLYVCIEKLRQINKETKDNEYNEFKELYNNFDIIDFEIAKKILYRLSNEEIINEDKLGTFQNLIKFINNNISSIDEECIDNVKYIFDKIKREDCWSDIQWVNINVNVEIILKLKVNYNI